MSLLTMHWKIAQLSKWNEASGNVRALGFTCSIIFMTWLAIKDYILKGKGERDALVACRCISFQCHARLFTKSVTIQVHLQLKRVSNKKYTSRLSLSKQKMI